MSVVCPALRAATGSVRRAAGCPGGVPAAVSPDPSSVAEPSSALAVVSLVTPDDAVSETGTDCGVEAAVVESSVVESSPLIAHQAANVTTASKPPPTARPTLSHGDEEEVPASPGTADAALTPDPTCWVEPVLWPEGGGGSVAGVVATLASSSNTMKLLVTVSATTENPDCSSEV